MRLLLFIICLFCCLNIPAQNDVKETTDSVSSLFLQIFKFPDGSTKITHSGEIVPADLCGMDIVDSVNLAEKYIPYLKNKKIAIVYWVAEDAKPFMTLNDILKKHQIEMDDADIIKINNYRMQKSELQPLFSQGNIYSVEKNGNVIYIKTNHFLKQKEMGRQGKGHLDNMSLSPKFWPTDEDLKNREELRKR